MKTKRFLILLAVTTGLACAQQNRNFDNVQVHVLPVQGNVYMLVGAGGNVTVQVGKDGVLIVDTEFAPMADKILAAIRTLSNGPIRYIINTHYHGDHTGGNEKLRTAGSTIAGAQRRGRSERRRRRRPDYRAQQRAEPHERANRSTGAVARRRLADRHLSWAIRRSCGLTAKAWISFIHPTRTPMATASCSSAGPT